MTTRTTHTRNLSLPLRHWRIGLSRMVWWKFIVAVFLLTFAAKLLAIVLFGAITGIEDGDIPDRAQRVGWFVAIIVAPLLETLIAQALVVWIVRKILPGSFLLPIVVSAILFGCGHQVSPVYMTCTMLIGFVWAFAYLSRLDSKRFASAFWLTAIVHALNNLIAFIHLKWFA